MVMLLGDGPSAAHLFCGGGGDVLGFNAAGFRAVEAANHDRPSCDTIEANFPLAARCVDLDKVNMRRLAPADVLVGSPICTEISPSSGNAPMRHARLGDDENAADSTWERTRLTSWDLLRYAEVHRPAVVCGENVPEWVTGWLLFGVWESAWDVLGYQRPVLVSINAGHLAGADFTAVPQLRDRVLFLIARKGVPLPGMSVRPDCVCPECGPVLGVQSWRNPDPRVRKVGRYGGRSGQYDYRCPNAACRHRIVSPLVQPIREVIDWDLPTRRVGDGKSDKRFIPYASTTRGRIQDGIDAHGHDPFVAVLRRNSHPVPLSSPIPSVTAQGNHFALITHIGRKAANRTTDDPLTTVATRPHHALATLAPTVDDSQIRMLWPKETKQVQGFPAEYAIAGNDKEQKLQIGNAVPATVARWLGERVMACFSASEVA